MDSIEKFFLEICRISNNRFEIQRSSEVIDDFLLSASEELLDRAVLRVRRTGNTKGGWRTLLVASMRDKKDLAHVIRWAAECRDLLSEPEASDLYLFIDTNACNFSQEEAIRIESSEQFCRKYVTRPDEELTALLTRTFLWKLIGTDLHTNISDPLIDAFKKTGVEHAWFNEEAQSLWRKSFLSGESGSDLVDMLFLPINSKEEL